MQKYRHFGGKTIAHSVSHTLFSVYGMTLHLKRYRLDLPVSGRKDGITMSCSNSDPDWDFPDLEERISGPKSVSDQTKPDPSGHTIPSETSASTSSSDHAVQTTVPTDEPFTQNGHLPVCTIESSYLPGKGVLVEIKQNGETVQVTRPYGIGIDTHKCFISVTVITCSKLQYIRFQQDFPTTSYSILQAKEWALDLIRRYCDPPVTEEETLHYCIESTATLHYPVLKLWGGKPSVVNPVLAKAGRRKTDHIDSSQLASSDITDYWRASFVPDDDVNELRVLVNERDYYSRLATKVSNRISNTLARFGYTISREGSVTKNEKVRDIVKNLIAEKPIIPETFHLPPIPADTRAMLREDYGLFEQFDQRCIMYKEKMMAKARSMTWETGQGSISGSDMVDMLSTAPQVGDVTAVVWLANIVTPLRFPNAKALAAYCGLDPSVKTSAGKKTSDKKRGGNVVLHKTLCACGNRLLARPTEMFGRWGNSMVKKGTSRSRARNAVARKLAVALYYMMLYNKPFSYEKYDLPQEMILLDISIQEFTKMVPKFRRYIRFMDALDVSTTGELIRAYVTCRFDHVDGLGPKFFKIVRDFIDNQHDYRDKWEALTNEPVRSQ